MLVKAVKKGDKKRYHVVSRLCLGHTCFQPGMYQHRGLSGGGSKTSGRSAVCLHNANHGCPITPRYSKSLEQERKAKGWKIR